MLALVAGGLVPLSQSMNVQAEKDNGPNAYGSGLNKKHDGLTIQNIICDNRIINVNGDVNGADTPQTQETPQTLDFMDLLKPIDAQQTEDTQQTQDTQTEETPQTQHSMGLLEPKEVTNEQTETDSANIPTGNRFRDGNNIAKELLCLNQNNANNNGQNGETPPSPPEISGCEGCFIEAVSNSGDPQGNAAKLILKLNSDAGIAITIGSRVSIVHSPFAVIWSQVDSAVDQVIQQAGLVFTAQETAALKQCVRDAVGV